MSSEFIKVSQSNPQNQVVDVKNIKPINRIKIVRPEEESYSSEESYSTVSDEEIPVKKKTKKIIRKKENHQPQPQQQRNRYQDYSAFSNPKKVSQRANDHYDEEESEYTDESSEMGSYSEQSEPEIKTTSFEEKQKLKQDLLIKISALEKKGFEFSKKFNMTSNYEEMMFEYEKIKKFIESQAGIKFARRCLMACVTGIEFLNKKFDPFSVKLEGWSENVMENVDDYDNIFEKLHEKYAEKAEVAPEIELLLTLGGSAFMFHLTNSLLRGGSMNMNAPDGPGTSGPANPNIMQSMMGALNNSMNQMNQVKSTNQINQMNQMK
jgi:hypothetical protein